MKYDISKHNVHWHRCHCSYNHLSLMDSLLRMSQTIAALYVKPKSSRSEKVIVIYKFELAISLLCVCFGITQTLGLII